MKTLTLCVLLLTFTYPLKALIAGGGITYENIGQDRFLVHLTLHQNCFVTAIDSSVGLLATPIGCTTSSITKSATLDTFYDVTNTCNSICNTCQNSGCTNPYGYRKDVYSVIFYLPDTSCTSWKISSQVTRLRDWKITTGGALAKFYVDARLTTGLANSSPTFIFDNMNIICAGQCQFLSYRCYDKDGDSLVYSFICPATTENNTVNYLSPYSCLKPFYFNGFPNNKLSPDTPGCRGFHLDSTSGDMVFRPMTAQVSIFAIKVEEYRNGNKIGEIKRDIEVVIANCDSTAEIPEFSTINGLNSDTLTTYTCPGDTVSFDFTVKTNYQHPTKLTIDSNIQNYFLDTISDSSGTLSSSFNWIVPANFNKPFTVSITAEALTCPFTNKTTKSFYIVPLNHPKITITQDNCGEFIFNPPPEMDPGNYEFSWTINDTLTDTSQSLKTYFTTNGNYPFSFNASKAFCNFSLQDSFEVKVSDLTVINSDTLVCEKDSITLSPAKTGGTPPFIYYWQEPSISAPTYSLVAKTDTTFHVTVADSLGCIQSGIVEVNVKPLPHLQLMGSFQRCEDDTALIMLTGTPAGGTWLGPGVIGQLFDPITAGVGGHHLQYYFTATNGCTAVDSVFVRINELPPIDAGPEKWLCYEDSPLPLQGFPTGGTWSGPGVVNNTFIPAGLTGDFWLHYALTDGNGCSNNDSVLVHLSAPPTGAISIPSLCPGTAFNLNTLNTGAVFRGTGVDQNIFYTDEVGIGTHQIFANRSYNQQCIHTDTVDVEVVEGPKAGYTATPLSGNLPLTVNFTDTSLGQVVSWHWQFSNDISDSSNLQSPQFTYIDTGLFVVTLMVVDSAGCPDEIAKPSYINVLPTGIAEIKPIELKLYPNPASDYIIIEIREPERHKYQVQLINAEGKVVQELSINSNVKKQIIRKELANGNYIILISRNGKKLLTKQLVLE